MSSSVPVWTAIVTALLVLGGHLLDVFWLVLPAFAHHPAASLLPLLALLLTLAAGALCLAVFSWRLQTAFGATGERSAAATVPYG